MSYFKKARNFKKGSSKILDEKIAKANQEFKKTGVLEYELHEDDLHEKMGTKGLYYADKEIPAIPAEYTPVPDPNGVTQPGFTPPDGGYDANDPSTWDNAFKDTDWLRNPNEVAGETNRQAVLGLPDSMRIAAQNSRLPHNSSRYPDAAGEGGGFVIAGPYHGTALGYLGKDGEFRQVCSGGLIGGTNAPHPDSRGYGGYYNGLTDEEFDNAVWFWEKYQELIAKYGHYNIPTVGVSMWIPWSYFWHGSAGATYELYPYTKSNGMVLTGGSVVTDQNEYESSPYVPAWNQVIFQDDLGNPSNLPIKPLDEILGDLYEIGQGAVEGLQDLLGDIADDVKDFVSNAIDNIAETIGDTVENVAETIGDIAENIGESIEEVADWAQNTTGDVIDWAQETDWEAVTDAAGTVLNVADAAMTVGSIIGFFTPEPITTAAGTAGLASTVIKFRNAYNASRGGRNLGRGLRGIRIGATGLKDSGFQNLRGDLPGGPAGTHHGSGGLLSPGGQGAYSAPTVGGVRPGNTVRPGTGGGRYTQQNSNPIRNFIDTVSGKTPEAPGGVVGTVVPGGTRSTGLIEPQNVVTPAQFTRGTRVFNDIMNGKNPNSALANRLRDQAAAAGFKPGQSSIPFSDLPVLRNDVEYSGLELNEEEQYSFRSILGEEESDKQDLMIMKLMNVPGFRKKLPAILKAMEEELKILELYHMINGVDESEGKKEDPFRKNKKKVQNEEFLEGTGQLLIEKNYLRDRREERRSKQPKKRKAGDKVSSLKIDGPKDHLTVKAVDMLRNHYLTESEKKEYARKVGLINQWIRDNPKEYEIWKVRYPKKDPRLATLNWELDQKLRSSEEYLETRFPENQKLYAKLKKKIKYNIDATNPKRFEKEKSEIVYTKLLKVSKAIKLDTIAPL